VHRRFAIVASLLIFLSVSIGCSKPPFTCPFEDSGPAGVACSLQSSGNVLQRMGEQYSAPTPLRSADSSRVERSTPGADRDLTSLSNPSGQRSDRAGVLPPTKPDKWAKG
jgi:hypothetical protein